MKARSCFGDASVFAFTSSVCAGCAHRAGCIDGVKGMLGRIASPAAATLLKQHERYAVLNATDKRALTEAEERVAKTLPVKIESQYRRIVGEGFIPAMRSALASRTNPFSPAGYKYLHVAWDALLAGGFTKKELRRIYMGECGWSEGTAFSAVSIVWQLLVACGVAVESGGVLMPKNGDDNND